MLKHEYIGIYTYILMASKISLAASKIRNFFSSGRHVYKQTDLRTILQENREIWKLPQGMSSTQFISWLLSETELNQVRLTSEQYDPITKYVWNNPSVYSVALALRPNSYLSHATAVYLHGLNEHIPRTIYVNKEQSPKPPPAAPPSQESITRTFSNRQRESNYIYSYKNSKIVILSGKSTGQLEVADLKGPEDEMLRVTRIPRTLVDIAVRPSYSGGVFQVIEAYRGAKDRVSINTVIAVLKQLNYSYPYHQAIGFYMTKAGFPATQVAKLKELGLKFDFYLDYSIPEKQREYDAEWRLFYPKGLQ